jgi:hypothetical protein
MSEHVLAQSEAVGCGADASSSFKPLPEAIRPELPETGREIESRHSRPLFPFRRGRVAHIARPYHYVEKCVAVTTAE